MPPNWNEDIYQSILIRIKNDPTLVMAVKNCTILQWKEIGEYMGMKMRISYPSMDFNGERTILVDHSNLHVDSGLEHKFLFTLTMLLHANTKAGGI